MLKIEQILREHQKRCEMTNKRQKIIDQRIDAILSKRCEMATERPVKKCVAFNLPEVSYSQSQMVVSIVDV